MKNILPLIAGCAAVALTSATAVYTLGNATQQTVSQQPQEQVETQPAPKTEAEMQRFCNHMYENATHARYVGGGILDDNHLGVQYRYFMDLDNNVFRVTKGEVYGHCEFHHRGQIGKSQVVQMIPGIEDEELKTVGIRIKWYYQGQNLIRQTAVTEVINPVR